MKTIATRGIITRGEPGSLVVATDAMRPAFARVGRSADTEHVPLTVIQQFRHHR